MKSYARNLSTIKSENRAMIFQYVRPHPISRADIARRTGMSKSSVTIITNALIEEGQLVEIGAVEHGIGRHPVMLDIVSDYRYAIGLSIDRNFWYVCITDLKFNLLAYANYKTDSWDDPYALMDAAYEEILRLLARRDIPLSLCIGIGISAPGPIDYKNGTILNPPNFPLFQNIEIGEFFEKKFGLPTFVNNNTVLLAMLENALTPPDKHENFIYVLAGDGIGSAIMLGDHIHRGSGGLSGELGHTSIHSGGVPCPCGNNGCLECYISLKALRERFNFTSYERLVDDAYLGDSFARSVIEFIADEFSCGLINAVNLLELDAVIIYGAFSYRPDMLRAALEDRIRKKSVITRTHDVKVRFANITPDLVRASACAAVLDMHFEQKL